MAGACCSSTGPSTGMVQHRSILQPGPLRALTCTLPLTCSTGDLKARYLKTARSRGSASSILTGVRGPRSDFAYALSIYDFAWWVFGAGTEALVYCSVALVLPKLNFAVDAHLCLAMAKEMLPSKMPGITAHQHGRNVHRMIIVACAALQILYNESAGAFTMLFHLDTPSFALTSVGVAKASEHAASRTFLLSC